MAGFPSFSPGANPGGAPSFGGGASSISTGSPISGKLGTPATGTGATHGPVGGKNSHQQDLVSPHSGSRTTLTKGDTVSRSMGQYGKGHDATASLMGSAGTSLPLSGGNTALRQIRGGTGKMARIRGGLGPGKTGQAGTTPAGGDYKMNNFDTE